MCVRNKKSGFTLIEIMVSMVISSLVIAGVYGVYTIQQRSYTVQDQVTETQQRLRSAVDFMTRDMRMINYAPEDCGLNKARNGIQIFDSTSFSFEYCDEKGLLNKVDYYMEDSKLMRRLDIDENGALARTIAEGVDGIEFQYLAGNRAPQTSDPDKHDKYEPLAATAVEDIRIVRISMLVRSSYPDPRHTDSTQYIPASGTPWASLSGGSGNPPNDNFHRRLLVTSIELRNVGL